MKKIIRLAILASTLCVKIALSNQPPYFHWYVPQLSMATSSAATVNLADVSSRFIAVAENFNVTITSATFYLKQSTLTNEISFNYDSSSVVTPAIIAQIVTQTAYIGATISTAGNTITAAYNGGHYTFTQNANAYSIIVTFAPPPAST